MTSSPLFLPILLDLHVETSALLCKSHPTLGNILGKHTVFLVLILALASPASPGQFSPAHALQMHRPAHPVPCLPQCLAEVSTVCSFSPPPLGSWLAFRAQGSVGWRLQHSLSAETPTNTSWLKGKPVLLRNCCTGRWRTEHLH